MFIEHLKYNHITDDVTNEALNNRSKVGLPKLHFRGKYRSNLIPNLLLLESSIHTIQQFPETIVSVVLCCVYQNCLEVLFIISRLGGCNLEKEKELYCQINNQDTTALR